VRAEDRPLVVTGASDLLDEVLGVAAAVGVAVDVAVDVAACGPQWTRAPMVVIGDDVVPLLAAAQLRRRPGVVVAGKVTPDDAVRAAAVGVAAEDLLVLPGGEARLAERLADAVEPARVARVVGVVGGCGGAGASVTAATLALVAARRQGAAWLVDLDPLGGGADLLLGAELEPGARWPELRSTVGRLSARSLRDALPCVHGVAILSCDTRCSDDPLPAALHAVLSAARRGGGTVVLDLPRHQTAAWEPAFTVLDEVIAVVPASVRAVLAARQVLRRMGAGVRRRLIVRSVPGGVLEDEVVRVLGVTSAGMVDEEPAVRTALLTGAPGALASGTALARLCGRILDAPELGLSAA
jgi:secretion/DNA translocation related CpaE-like protein